MIVVDASVVATALGDDGADGVRARARLLGEVMLAPALLDLEVVAVWRRQARLGLLTPSRATHAVFDLVASPIQRTSPRPLLRRCWELRETVTPYDAAYLALAEALAVPLVTADARLSRASGPRCAVEVLT